MCSCIICHKEMIARGIHTHIDRTHLKLTKYSSGNNGKYDVMSMRSKVEKDERITEYLLNPNFCTNCNTILDYESRNNKFCNHSCSASATNKTRIMNGWTHSNESRDLIRDSLRKYNISMGKSITPKDPYDKICEYCKIEFKTFSIKNRFCSVTCSHQTRKIYCRLNRSAFINYRYDCAFKFNLKDFPQEFNFTLIEEFGWYKAKNHGDNPNGVSRDHMISVRYGFDNNIDPAIIARPANCELMPHNKNSSKHIKCSLSLDELNERIQIWDLKYN